MHLQCFKTKYNLGSGLEIARVYLVNVYYGQASFHAILEASHSCLQCKAEARRRGKESSGFTDGDPGELGIGKALRQSVKTMARTRALGESWKDREKAIKSWEGQQLPGGG